MGAQVLSRGLYVADEAASGGGEGAGGGGRIAGSKGRIDAWAARL